VRYEYFSTFLTVIEKGSLLAAAKHLNTSVGTVSFQVGKLEEFFGVKLLERSASGVKLTEDGRRASEKMRSIISEIEELKMNFSRAPKRAVRIAFGNVPGVSVFPGALEEFRKENPDIEVTVRIKNSTECSSLLSSNDVDIAAACFILKEIDSERYSTIRLGTDRLVLVVSQEHELAGQGEIRLKDVLPLPIVMIGKDSGITKFLIQGLENYGYGLKDLNIVAEVNSVYTQLHSVANGLGVAITSKLAAEGMDNCKIIDITDFNVNRTIYIIYSRSSADSGTKKLVDFLTEKGRELLKNN
jgi:DNA-binding transcriptional LysR family regulator